MLSQDLQQHQFTFFVFNLLYKNTLKTEGTKMTKYIWEPKTKKKCLHNFILRKVDK